MDEQILSNPNPENVPKVIFTEPELDEFRAAGVWMVVVGVVEVIAGIVLLAITVSSWFGLLPGVMNALFPSPLEMGTAGIQIAGTLGIGFFTAWTGLTFRSVAAVPTKTDATVKAVARLRHLYSSQAIVFALLFGVFVIGALMGIPGR